MNSLDCIWVWLWTTSEIHRGSHWLKCLEEFVRSEESEENLSALNILEASSQADISVKLQASPNWGHRKNHGFLESPRLLSTQCYHSRHLGQSWTVPLLLWQRVVGIAAGVRSNFRHHSAHYVPQVRDTRWYFTSVHVKAVLAAANSIVYTAGVINHTVHTWIFCVCRRSYLWIHGTIK